MKRIKTLILSAAVIMVAVTAGSQVVRADEPAKQYIVAESPENIAGGTFTILDEDGNFTFNANCPILDLDGTVKGETSMTAAGHMIIENGQPIGEVLDSASYTWAHEKAKKGLVTSNNLTVVGFAQYESGTPGVIYANCVCKGTVSGEWLGAPVNQVFCNCLFEITMTSETTGTVRCKSCVCTFTYA